MGRNAHVGQVIKFIQSPANYAPSALRLQARRTEFRKHLNNLMHCLLGLQKLPTKLKTRLKQRVFYLKTDVSLFCYYLGV